MAISLSDEQLVIDHARCGYCGLCVAVCPKGALNLRDAHLELIPSACTVCKRCIPACPIHAIGLRAEVGEDSR